MVLTKKSRTYALAIALIATVIAVFSSPSPEVEAQASTETSNSKETLRRNTFTNELEVPIIKIKRNNNFDPSYDPFASRVEPNVAALAIKQEEAPPPAAIVPDIPYIYVGKMVEEEDTIVFLTKQDDSYSVRKGDTLDNLYRVDDVSERAISLTHLPSNQKQSIDMRSGD